MADGDKMKCERCGVEMNLHAEKVDYTAALEGDAAPDAELGGVIEEFHTCPACGRTRERPADS